jgi:lysosomal alpha-mannosidase
VGPIPFQDGLGREVVSVWSTGTLFFVFVVTRNHVYSIDLMANQTWYTDSNGRDMQVRKFNYRPTWNLMVTDPFDDRCFLMRSAVNANQF